MSNCEKRTPAPGAKAAPRPTIRSLVCVVALASLPYLNALANRFVSYDDRMLVVENDAVRRGQVAEILRGPLRGTYLPLRALSHALDCAAFGLRPWGHHLTNLALHAFNSALVLWLLCACGLSAGASFAGAAVFAAHAVHTEAVTWVSGRRDVLFACFYLLGFLAYLRFRRCGRAGAYLAALAAFAAACLSKGMAVTFLPALVAYDWTRGVIARRGIARYAGQMAAFAAVAFGFAALHALLGERAGAIRSYHAGSPPATLYAMCGVAASYARLLLAPTHLCANYYFPADWLPSWPQAALGAALVAGGAAFALARPRPGFWVWWMFANLLTVLNLAPLSTLEAERYLYLPSVGFAALAGQAARRAGPRAGTAGLLAALLAFAALTCRRNFDWRGTPTLWRSTLLVCPRNPKALGELALVEQYEYGRPARAAALLRRSLRENPRLPRTHLNLGVLYAAQGRDALAEREFLEAIRLKPDLAKAHASLAALRLRQGRLDEAERRLRRALALEPRLPGAAELLARIRAAQAREAP